MAPISFKTPEKRRHDENSPLPRTPTPYKVHELTRSSSQKKARQLLDTIRGLKSKGKTTNETEECPKTAPPNRRNQTWDLLGTLRSKRSTEVSNSGLESSQTTLPWKLNSEAEDTPEIHPRRRKSLGDILGSITNKMSPTRNTPFSGHPVNNVDAGESSEDYVMEESLGCLKSLRDTQPTDLPGDSEAGTSQTQTLDDLDQISTSGTPISDETRSKTPDSWLELMIKSFESSDESSNIHKSAPSSPSLETLMPIRPVDFLDELGPNLAHDHRSNPSEHKQETDSPIIDHATETTTLDESGIQARGPVVTVTQVSCDSETHLTERHAITRHSSASTDEVLNVTERSGLAVRQLATPKWDNSQLVDPDPAFRRASNAHNFQYQELGVNYLDIAEADRQRIALSIKLTVDKMTKNLHLASVSEETQHEWDEEGANYTNTSRTDRSSGVGNGTGITCHCKDLSKEVCYDTWRLQCSRADEVKQSADLLSPLDPRVPSTSGIEQECSDREANVEDWHATPPLTPTESFIERPITNATPLKYPTFSGQLSSAAKAQTQSQQNIVRNHLSWFKKFIFPLEPLHVKYPATDTKRAQREYFENGRLAIASIYEENKGDYSDTITYHQKDSVIELHPWGWSLPRLDEYEVITRVQYPQTKTRPAEMKFYRNKDLALSDISCQQILYGNVFSNVNYDSSKHCYYISAYGDDDQHVTSSCNPVLSPLQGQSESEHELPDFSDVEIDFHPATTDSLKSSSSHYPDGSVFDDASVNQDMSMCVEAGTPHRKLDYEPYECNNNEFDVTMFIQGRPGTSEPFLRGTKKILQYLDCLDDGDSANRIRTSATDLQHDSDTSADISDKSEALSREDMVMGMSSIAEDQSNKLSELDFNSGFKTEDSEEDAASLAVKVVEHDGANPASKAMSNGFDFSTEKKVFENVLDDIPTTLRQAKVLPDSDAFNHAAMDTTVEGPRVSFESARHLNGLFANGSDGQIEREDYLTEDTSNKSRENIYIIPVEDIGLIEENAGYGNDDDASISGNAAHSPGPSQGTLEEHFDNMMDLHNSIIAAFRGEIEEFGFRHEGGLSEFVEETPVVSKWKRSSSFMNNQRNTECMPRPLEVQTNTAAELQCETIEPKTPLKDKKLDLVTEEFIQAQSPITVEDLNLRMIGKAARSSQSASRKDKRVGALVDIFQAHGMMAPTSPRLLLHRSPPRFQAQATPPKESKNENNSKMKNTVEEQREQTSTDEKKERREEEELSDGETDVSSCFGELLEKMNREVLMGSFCG
ncbi:hypothetical protein CJF31_00010405 [Rutstroemia sp. NJR-2017a BVV2]|nr:hypothetical protein CJF31_00010405 [Rutstroemia sp. NJR-2017a BVV2]